MLRVVLLRLLGAAASASKGSRGRFPPYSLDRLAQGFYARFPGVGKTFQSKFWTGAGSVDYSCVFSLESFSRMNASISAACVKRRTHCSL